MPEIRRVAFLLGLVFLVPGWASPSGAEVQRRVDRDAAAGRPVVVHVTVALCDNKYQGIVPVPKGIGNGQNPRTNLYWGAGYGVKSYFPQHGWKLVRRDSTPAPEILERVVFAKTCVRHGAKVRVYLIADAWDGKEIRSATERFLDNAAGNLEDTLPVVVGKDTVMLPKGGAAHLVAYVGHDGLMDFQIPRPPSANPDAAPRSSMILACMSRRFFGSALAKGASHPLLLTTGLMAPEAYTLEAAIDAWIADKPSGEVRAAAARAYDLHQHCGIKGATNLFHADP